MASSSHGDKIGILDPITSQSPFILEKRDYDIWLFILKYHIVTFHCHFQYQNNVDICQHNGIEFITRLQIV